LVWAFSLRSKGVLKYFEFLLADGEVFGVFTLFYEDSLVLEGDCRGSAGHQLGREKWGFVAEDQSVGVLHWILLRCPINLVEGDLIGVHQGTARIYSAAASGVFS